MYPKRKKDITDNINEAYELLHDYEKQLLLETEPRRKKQFEVGIEDCKKNIQRYEKELEEIGIAENAITNHPPHTVASEVTEKMCEHYTIFELAKREEKPKYILINPKFFGSVRELLDKLFGLYLKEIVPAHSYGLWWVINAKYQYNPAFGHFETPVLGALVPLESVINPELTASAAKPNWTQEIAKDEVLKPGAWYQIIIAESQERLLRYVGIVTNNPNFCKRVKDKGIYWHTEAINLEEAKKYRHQLVLISNIHSRGFPYYEANEILKSPEE